MMYIRTKDGIYKVSHYNAYATHKRKGETLLEGYKTAYIKNENIIAQSENLEELCDEFVGVDNTCENGHQFLMAVPYKCANFWNGGVYGCIWTSKGLIYVAKMDDEGDLRLL